VTKGGEIDELGGNKFKRGENRCSGVRESSQRENRTIKEEGDPEVSSDTCNAAGMLERRMASEGAQHDMGGATPKSGRDACLIHLREGKRGGPNKYIVEPGCRHSKKEVPSSASEDASESGEKGGKGWYVGALPGEIERATLGGQAGLFNVIAMSTWGRRSDNGGGGKFHGRRGGGRRGGKGV